MQLIGRSLALTIGCVGVEFLLNPARFFGSLLVAMILAFLGMWACWRVGGLFNLAYRPGLANALLALSAAACVLTGVVSLTAVSYMRSLVSATLLGGQAHIRVLNYPLPEVCRAVQSVFPHLNLEASENLALDCASPRALVTVGAELGSMSQQIHDSLQERLLQNQLLNVAGMIATLGVCLSIPCWSAYRRLVVHVGNYRH